MPSDNRFLSDRYPRSSKYHPEWVIKNGMSGANTLWLTEWLAEAMDLRPGMKVLDLGCGRAISSIFLAREFGVQVWAVDLGINIKRQTRLVQALNTTDPRQIAEQLITLIEGHRQGTADDDDMTLLCLFHNARGPRPPSLLEKLEVYAKVFGLKDY